ncbi:hypothetical protein LZ31DRAFT_292300 [Colletotrichum somersetense]|nr:hypothetical protein LZ31DRAFT_292300 [Colletotrichum somersetense]
MRCDAAAAAFPVAVSLRSRPPPENASLAKCRSGRSDPAVIAALRSSSPGGGVAGRAAEAYRVVLRTPRNGTRWNSQGFSRSRQVAIGERLVTRARRQSRRAFWRNVCWPLSQIKCLNGGGGGGGGSISVRLFALGKNAGPCWTDEKVDRLVPVVASLPLPWHATRFRSRAKA